MSLHLLSFPFLLLLHHHHHLKLKATCSAAQVYTYHCAVGVPACPLLLQ